MPYNNICTTIIVHIIFLILGEIWSKRSNFTSLLLVKVFAEVNTEALNIKSCQPWQKHCSGKAKACIFSNSYIGILLAAAKNAEIQGLLLCGGWQTKSPCRSYADKNRTKNEKD